MVEVVSAWQRIHRWIDNNAFEFGAHLCPGAGPEDLQDLQSTLGVSLPDDFLELYRIHNGTYMRPLFHGCNFFSIEEIIAEWQRNKDELEKYDFNNGCCCDDQTDEQEQFETADEGEIESNGTCNEDVKESNGTCNEDAETQLKKNGDSERHEMENGSCELEEKEKLCTKRLENGEIISADDLEVKEEEKNATEEEVESKIDEGSRKESGSKRKVQYKWWDSHWIPFAGSTCGDTINIDLAPARAGNYGQIFVWRRDFGSQLLADDVVKFLQNFADDLEKGRYDLS